MRACVRACVRVCVCVCVGFFLLGMSVGLEKEIKKGCGNLRLAIEDFGSCFGVVITLIELWLLLEDLSEAHNQLAFFLYFRLILSGFFLPFPPSL